MRLDDGGLLAEGVVVGARGGGLVGAYFLDWEMVCSI